ncbi:hypothetical protein AB0I77_05120 [Streptomyces sp. NPDC050619]|uniref:hypothetical protein n=1 Tax=Streptomyces sp. NPDC050619 TaxID=3157214 RepID=UPI00342FE89F
MSTGVMIGVVVFALGVLGPARMEAARKGDAGTDAVALGEAGRAPRGDTRERAGRGVRLVARRDEVAEFPVLGPLLGWNAAGGQSAPPRGARGPRPHPGEEGIARRSDGPGMEGGADGGRPGGRRLRHVARVDRMPHVGSGEHRDQAPTLRTIRPTAASIRKASRSRVRQTPVSKPQSASHSKQGSAS